jgi:LysM repeat protein
MLHVGAERDTSRPPDGSTIEGMKTWARIAALAGPVVAAGLMLGACGGGSEGATKEPIVLDQGAATNYVTLPIETLPPTTIDGATTSAPETAGAAATEYTIKSGDFPLGVADKFGLELAQIAQANGWSSCAVTGCAEFPGPGSVIKIPAGGKVPSEATGEGTDTVDPSETGSTIPTSGDNCAAGKYTIAAGDVPFAVAKKFDVTFERLQAANSGIDFTKSFPVGQEIVIPAAEDC